MEVRCVNLHPTKGETERRITESRSITGETSRHGQPSSHLTEGSHDEEDDETNDSVRDEDGARTSLGESLAGTDDETRSDRTTDGNHGNVAGLEASVKHGIRVGLDTSNVLVDTEVLLAVALTRAIVAAEVRLLDIVAGHGPLVDAVAHDGRGIVVVGIR